MSCTEYRLWATGGKKSIACTIVYGVCGAYAFYHCIKIAVVRLITSDTMIGHYLQAMTHMSASINGVFDDLSQIKFHQEV
jgi:hypothetical protein